MKLTEKQEEIIDICIENRTKQPFKGCLGSGCHKIIKLTDEKVIFKPCHEKGNLTYYFNKDEFDDTILLYMLEKSGGVGTHWYLDRSIDLYPSYKVKELSDAEMKMKVLEMIEAFDMTYTSEIMDYLEINVAKAIGIIKELEKEGMIKTG